MEGLKPSKSWEAAAYNRETNEWDTTTLHSYDHSENVEPWQATAANITPSTPREMKKDYTSIFLYTDPHIGFRRVLDHDTGDEELIPLHDERKMRVMRRLARYAMPDIIINLGDNIDAPESGRFDPDSDHFYRTLAPTLQAAHNYYAELRADHPNAKIYELDGNHTVRPSKKVLKQVPELYGVMRAGEVSKYPMFSYPYMANLEHVGVEFIDGYPSAELIIPRLGGAALRFAHGRETSSGAGSAAAKAMKNNPETYNFQGHAHQESSAWRTNVRGEQLGSFVLGALCSTTGAVPSYHNSVSSSGAIVRHQENWQSSVAQVRIYEDQGIEINTIQIDRDSVAYYEGKRFDGEQG